MVPRMTPPTADNRKCYGQFCPMATALDVIGDRWTILILRELLGGAGRFHELQEGLPGIAKNLLTDRLRRLESDGIVRRVRSHSAVLYALTERGAAARTAVEELGFWGSTLEPIVPPQHPRSTRAIAMALQAVLARAGDVLPDVRHVIELEIDGEHIQIVLDARPSASAGPSTDADARIRVPRPTMSDFLLGRSFDKKRFVHISGDKAARTALIRALGTMARTHSD
jgi:DNA-binding HxlR family transcriptional regulator